MARSIGLVGCLVAAAIVVAAPGEAVHASSSVTGTVFQDFNSNGAMDTAVASGQAIDVGIAGITVTATDATGTQVGTATTDADGDYTLSVTSTAGTALRVEFEVPSSGPLAALHPSFQGTGNGTTIQFVQAGAINVDAAFNVPGEYCQANPSISVSRLCAGESTQVSGNPSIFVSRYDGGPYTTANSFTNVYTDWTSNTAGESDLTGAVLGMAWDPSTLRIYNTAYIRRHAEVYESGGAARPAALFVTTPDTADGLGGTTRFLADLEGLLPGDQFSNSTPGQVGYIPTNAARELDRIEDGTNDGGADNDGVDSDQIAGEVGVYEEVGQTGIGDIEVDGEGNLYVVSLYDRNLYKVTMPTDGSAPTVMTSLGDITSGVTCTKGQGRPFSITRWRGSLYLGMTCDGSAEFPANAANYSPTTSLDTNISFTVRRFDLSAGTWSTFFGPQSLAGVGKGSVDGVSSAWAQTARRWNPWTNSYPNPPVTVNGADTFGVRPVPLLSDIEFDADGSMIVGFRDRTGDQLATDGSETPIGTETSYPAIASGDVYRVCRTGTGYTTADYTFEGGTGCTQSTDSSNGTEYYWGDKYFSYHYEISTGMIDQVPGFPDVLLTAFDPYDGDGTNKTFYSGGIRYMRNSTGERSPSFPNNGSGVLYFASSFNAGNPNSAGGFMKTNGMSDVEALCDAAPVQIGNRVWIDTDEDGIQDPGETPVAGVTVRLYAADGTTLLGTAVTDAEGRYYFSSNLTEATAGTGDHLGGGLVIGEAHVVRFDEADDYAAGGPLAGYTLTAVDEGSSDSVDSDATTVRGYPEIAIPARLAGENDHTFDVGFVPIVGFGDHVWIDADTDGVQDPGEAPLAGVVVNVLDADGDPILDADGDPVTATTDADGYYFIDGLAAGDYRAEFVLPAGYSFTVTGGGTSASDSNPDPSTDITPVFTITGSVSGDTVADNDQGTTAAFVNPTIDAGVIPTVSVGDYVWWDTNGDGRQDATDVPIEGVTLTITTVDGGPVTDAAGRLVTTTVTDADGRYSFDNLPLGQYKVTVTAPERSAPTIGGVGSVDGDSSTGHAISRNLQVGGDRDPTLDFGFVPLLVTVGDLVWVDADNDGIQDDGEQPLAGAVLTLTDIDGNPVTDVAGQPVPAQTTGADGRYLFENLPAGRYTVTITYPAGYGPTRPGQGSEVGDDSSSFTATTRQLAAGESDLTLDFGVVPIVSVGDYVWWDSNRDGRQDATDVPLEGVTLTITTVDDQPVFDAQGRPVTTTVTDAMGWYTFDNLPLGQYKVTVTAPRGFEPTVGGVGSVDGDSSTGHAISRNLHVGGDRDPTLDFGFINRAVLPATGLSADTTTLGLAVMFWGTVLIALARRRRGT